MCLTLLKAEVPDGVPILNWSQKIFWFIKFIRKVPLSYSHIWRSKIHKVWPWVCLCACQTQPEDMTGSWQHWDTIILNTYLFQALLEWKTKTHKQNQTWWRSGPGTLVGRECVCVCQTAAYRVWHKDHCWRHSLSAK